MFKKFSWSVLLLLVGCSHDWAALTAGNIAQGGDDLSSDASLNDASVEDFLTTEIMIQDLSVDEAVSHDMAVVDDASMDGDVLMPDLFRAYDLAGEGGKIFPMISKITPAIGPSTGGVMVMIEGVNFVSGQGLTVEVGGKTSLVVQWVSSTNLTASLPVNPGKF